MLEDINDRFDTMLEGMDERVEQASQPKRLDHVRHATDEELVIQDNVNLIRKTLTEINMHPMVLDELIQRYREIAKSR
jgi:hypothetical protein